MEAFLNIIVYSLMAYAITAVISFGVIGFVVLMAKAFQGHGDEDAS